MKKTSNMIFAVILLLYMFTACVPKDNTVDTTTASNDEIIMEIPEDYMQTTAGAATELDTEIDIGSELTIESEINVVFDHTVLPDYSGEPFLEVNNNVPYFTADEITNATDNMASWEVYSELDALSRPQVAFGCLSGETMPGPDEERGAIGHIRPAGWHTVKYPEVISDLYLYNRCHLIGWQLGNENDNELNLITGTRYLNVEGMLPFENQVADYIKNTGNHVLYRVTPCYTGDNLICDGILIEAQSLEDNGCVFAVYCYNVQPHIEIDYATGESQLSVETPKDDGKDNERPEKENTESSDEKTYIINTNSGVIHSPECQFVADIKEDNIWTYKDDIDKIIDEYGFRFCQSCGGD